MNKALRLFTLGAAMAVAVSAMTVAGVRDARAAVIDLGFLLDESGSVGSANYNTAKSALASALSLIPTAGPNQYRVGVFSFATGVQTLVAPTILTAGNLAAAQAAINADPFSAGSTNTPLAINTLVTAFGGLNDTSLINITTDGNPFLSGVPDATMDANTLAAGAAAQAAGWDSLSAEAIGNNVDTTFLLGLVFPLPGVLVNAGDPIPNPLTQGFVIAVANFDAYGDAISAKIQQIVNPVPLPGALPLFVAGLGVMGFAGGRRRRGVAAA